MRSHWKRLVLAACLSFACAGATLAWYYHTNEKSVARNEQPLAQAARASGEVTRRPSTRLLWQPVNSGDNLYSGETLRTSDQSEIRIQFEDGRHIDLEPESLIVLQEKQGQISLDLLDGSLFVDAKSASANSPKLVLNSGQESVNLAGATASLSKDSENGLNLHVYEGKARVQSADGKEKDVEKGKESIIGSAKKLAPLLLLSPRLDRPLVMSAEDQRPVVFSWSGTTESLKVHLRLGANRRDLQESAEGPKSGGHEISVRLPVGKSWFKLTAEDPKTNQIVAESPLGRIEVRLRYPSTLLLPHADEALTVEKTPADVRFSWKPAQALTSIRLEVATDADFHDVVLSKSFAAGETSYTAPGLTTGPIYHARLSSTYADLEGSLIGKSRTFSLRLPERQIPVHIVWTVPSDRREQVYGVKPQLEFTWKSENRLDEIHRYRVTVQPENSTGSSPLRLEVEGGAARTQVAKPGRYVASVEAFDKSGNIIGKSEPLPVAAVQAPLIAAPILEPPQGKLLAMSDGRIELKWNSVKNATRYWLTVEKSDGTQLMHQDYETSAAKLKNLMPGRYTLRLKAIDNYGRESEAGADRTLEVPNSSGLKAPKLKKVQVE